MHSSSAEPLIYLLTYDFHSKRDHLTPKLRPYFNERTWTGGVHALVHVNAHADVEAVDSGWINFNPRHRRPSRRHNARATDVPPILHHSSHVVVQRVVNVAGVRRRVRLLTIRRFIPMLVRVGRSSALRVADLIQNELARKKPERPFGVINSRKRIMLPITYLMSISRFRKLSEIIRERSNIITNKLRFVNNLGTFHRRLAPDLLMRSNRKYGFKPNWNISNFK